MLKKSNKSIKLKQSRFNHKNWFIRKNLDFFQPWGQTIDRLYLSGQAIPPGLHVRLNLETGQREAKLLDDTTAKEPSESTRAAYVTQGGFL